MVRKLALILLLFSVCYSQQSVTPDLTAFNSGEMGPLMHGRTDFSKYNKGCETLENMLVTSQGPVIRRPGTKYICEVKDSNNPVRLISFEYAVSDVYILEFGPRYIRFFRNGGQILDVNSAVYEIDSPFDDDELDDIQYTQSADVMYLVDGNDRPQKLSRSGHTSWTLEPIDFNDGPFQDENTTTTTITISNVIIDSNTASAWVTSHSYLVGDRVTSGGVLYTCIKAHSSGSSSKPGTGSSWQTYWKSSKVPSGKLRTATGRLFSAWFWQHYLASHPSGDEYTDGYTEPVNGTVSQATVTLTASKSIFSSTDVNSLWQITHKRASSSLEGQFSGTGTSASLLCEGDYTAVTHGTWAGTIQLERSTDNGETWDLVEPRSVDKDDNMLRSDTEIEDDVLYRFNMMAFTSGTCKYSFLAHESYHSGNVLITDYNSGTSVTGIVKHSLAGTGATKKWNKPYWSDTDGWPRTVELYEERLIFGGSRTWPQAVWMSRTCDYQNMYTGSYEDSALIYVLPSQNPIQWLLAQTYLMIGTSSGTGRLGGSTADEPITPTSISYRGQTNNGSAGICAILAGDSILYVERGNRRVRELVYDFVRDKYVSPDMTILSDHITESGIKEVAYQGRPNPVLWCIRNDGDIAALTFEKDNEVVGWSHQLFGGDGFVESAAVVPSLVTDTEDEVWFVIKRTINSIVRRYIEQLQPADWGSDQIDCFFVDSGLSWDGGNAVNITGITKAKPAIVTVSSWPVDSSDANLADGDHIKIIGVKGMTQLNNTVFEVNDANIVAKTFSLRNSAGTLDINSISYGTWSAGTVQRFEKIFTELGHLEGETVSILSDGGILPDTTVSDGNATVSQWTNKIYIGLPYYSVLQTMPLLLKTQMGSLALNQKRLCELGIDFYNSAGAEYGTSAANLQEINFREITSDPNSPVPLFTGTKRLSVQAGWNDVVSVYIRQKYALPLTVRSITMKVDVAR